MLIIDKDGARLSVIQKDGTELPQPRCLYCGQALRAENYPHKTIDVCAQHFHDNLVPELVREIRRLRKEQERRTNPIWRWIRSWTIY